MNAGRAKKIRQMIGYDVGADNIMGRQYQWNSQEKTKGMKTFRTRTNIVCVGIRRSYRQLKKKINRREQWHILTWAIKEFKER